MDFPRKLKEIRLKHNTSSIGLSFKIGKARTYISQLERGLIKKPSFAVINDIFEALSLPNEERIELFKALEMDAMRKYVKEKKG